MSLNSAGQGIDVDAAGMAHIATAHWTGDGSGSVVINIGFIPTMVELFDMTGIKRYTWVLGMPATDTMLATNGALAVDTNSAVLTQWKLFSNTGGGTYAPGSQGPGEGTLISGAVSYYGPDKTLSYQLTIGINVTSSLYQLVAHG